jgi:adenosylcobinamide-phosphate guanylyltransferase
MYAVIMAGGTGSRLNRGEKPLVLINNRPLLSYITDAFSSAGCNLLVATSGKTPMTRNWCRAQGIESCQTGGVDYIHDMIEAVEALGERHPLFVCVSDIPCIDTEIITTVRDAYASSGREACSVWVPSEVVRSCRGGLNYRETIAMVEACPTGLNILLGSRIAETQDEFQLVLADPRLGINVNTEADLHAAEQFLLSGPGSQYKTH